MDNPATTTNNTKLMMGLGAIGIIVIITAFAFMSSRGTDSNTTDTNGVTNSPTVPSAPNDHGHSH